MSPISIQVIAPIITNFFHCMHCEHIFSQAEIDQQVHAEELDQYPEYVKQEVAHLADWLSDLVHRYGNLIHIRVIDSQSPEGFLKSLRYWVRKYPTFIVDGREKVTGWDKATLDAVLKTRLSIRKVLG